jgi:hypothetical protein
MLTDATYVEALHIITEATDFLAELDSSVEGYIDLLEFAIEEFKVSLDAAKTDLGTEYDD